MAGKIRKKPQKQPAKSKGGRPSTAAEKVAAGLVHLDAGEAELAVKASGVSLATLYRHKAKRDTSSPAPAPPLPTPPAPASKAASVAKAASTTALPQGGHVDSRPDLLVLVRRILDARDPAARQELDDGLLVFGRGGEEALAPWLSRPASRSEPLDPLAAAVTALSAAAAHVEALPVLHPRAATMLGAVANLAARVENIGKGRPRAVSRDEVTERLEAIRDKAIERILPRARAAAAKLLADQAALDAWAAQEMSPRVAAELRALVSAMLGGT